MTELARRQPHTDGPTVWVLSTGEDHEGGTVLGVYASKDAAKRIPFDLDSAWQDEEDGSSTRTAAATGSPWSRTR